MAYLRSDKWGLDGCLEPMNPYEWKYQSAAKRQSLYANKQLRAIAKATPALNAGEMNRQWIM